MKLSELSYRDYIAIDVVGHLAEHTDADEAAKRAYEVADALLAEAGKRDQEMDELRERADKAERTLEVLRPVWAQGFTSDSPAAQGSANALAELWPMLAADNQTDAVETLRALKERDYKRLAGS